jgi:hypothetical protein
MGVAQPMVHLGKQGFYCSSVKCVYCGLGHATGACNLPLLLAPLDTSTHAFLCCFDLLLQLLQASSSSTPAALPTLWLLSLHPPLSC